MPVRPPRAALVFVTVLLDMLALGMSPPVLPPLVARRLRHARRRVRSRAHPPPCARRCARRRRSPPPILGVAAAFSLLNFVYGLVVLPESLPPERRAPFAWRRANPVGALTLLRSHPAAGTGRRAFPASHGPRRAAEHVRALHELPLRVGRAHGRRDAGRHRVDHGRRPGGPRAPGRRAPGRAHRPPRRPHPRRRRLRDLRAGRDERGVLARAAGGGAVGTFGSGAAGSGHPSCRFLRAGSPPGDLPQLQDCAGKAGARKEQSTVTFRVGVD